MLFELARFRAFSRKSLLVSDPQLKLMTRAPFFRANSMLSMRPKLEVNPLSSKAFMAMIGVSVSESDLTPWGLIRPEAIRAI